MPGRSGEPGGLGFWGLGVRVKGVQGLGFQDLGVRVKGVEGFRVKGFRV